MKAVYLSETVSTSKLTWCHNLQDHNLKAHCRKNHKSTSTERNFAFIPLYKTNNLHVHICDVSPVLHDFEVRHPCCVNQYKYKVDMQSKHNKNLILLANVVVQS